MLAEFDANDPGLLLKARDLSGGDMAGAIDWRATAVSWIRGRVKLDDTAVVARLDGRDDDASGDLHLVLEIGNRKPLFPDLARTYVKWQAQQN